VSSKNLAVIFLLFIPPLSLFCGVLQVKPFLGLPGMLGKKKICFMWVLKMEVSHDYTKEMKNLKILWGFFMSPSTPSSL